MRLLVMLLIVSGAAAQNATDEPTTAEGTDPDDADPVDTEPAAQAWWAQQNVQWGLSGVAVAALVATFVVVARR